MRLGSRWRFGGEPPASLPSVMRDAIWQAERQLAADHTEAQREAASWTLTWLENRPVCRNDLGVTLRLNSGDVVSWHHD